MDESDEHISGRQLLWMVVRLLALYGVIVWFAVVVMATQSGGAP